MQRNTPDIAPSVTVLRDAICMTGNCGSIRIGRAHIGSTVATMLAAVGAQDVPALEQVDQLLGLATSWRRKHLLAIIESCTPSAARLVIEEDEDEPRKVAMLVGAQAGETQCLGPSGTEADEIEDWMSLGIDEDLVRRLGVEDATAAAERLARGADALFALFALTGETEMPRAA